MERTEKVILTNMCIVYDGSKILVQEKVGKGFKGITFPGGHVDENEPIVDSVIREIKEETGLTIKSPELCGVKDWLEQDGMRYMVFLFKTNRFSGTLQSSEEGKVFWVEASEAKKLATMWHFEEMLKLANSGDYSEIFLDPTDNWKPVLK